MKFKTLTLALTTVLSLPVLAQDNLQKFEETISVYGVIKPARMTNLIAVNNGMVSKIPKRVGEKIKFGQVAISAIERETTRGYRSTLNGRVAKLHVSEGAAVTPGMPLVTIIDPRKKLVEVALSPAEGQRVQEGATVYSGKSEDVFGTIQSVSPLVDPDTGGVVSYVKPGSRVKALIGDVIPLRVVARSIDNCKVVPVSEVDNHLKKFRVIASSGNQVCLKEKNETQ